MISRQPCFFWYFPSGLAIGCFAFARPLAAAEPIHRTTSRSTASGTSLTASVPTPCQGVSRTRRPYPAWLTPPRPALPTWTNTRAISCSQTWFAMDTSPSRVQEAGRFRGISHQERNYFWYRRTFTAPAQNAVALLRINKAQFGAVLYLNGVRIGEHDPCFTSATFDVTNAIHWGATNELVIRIGAHPGVLPENVVCGTDFEKHRWTPGIYDDVTLMTMSNPVISVVQAAPQLASPSVPVAFSPDRAAQLRGPRHHHSSLATGAGVENQRTGLQPSRNRNHPLRRRNQDRHPVGARSQSPSLEPRRSLPLQSGHHQAGDSTETRFGMREIPL